MKYKFGSGDNFPVLPLPLLEKKYGDSDAITKSKPLTFKCLNYIKNRRVKFEGNAVT